MLHKPPIPWGGAMGAVNTLVGVDGHQWELSCLVVERWYECISQLSLCAPTAFYLFLQPVLDQRTPFRSEDRPPCNAFWMSLQTLKACDPHHHNWRGELHVRHSTTALIPVRGKILYRLYRIWEGDSRTVVTVICDSKFIRVLVPILNLCIVLRWAFSCTRYGKGWAVLELRY